MEDLDKKKYSRNETSVSNLFTIRVKNIKSTEKFRGWKYFLRRESAFEYPFHA